MILNSNFASDVSGLRDAASKESAVIFSPFTVIPMTAALFSSHVISNDLRTSPTVFSSSIVASIFSSFT